MRLRAIFLLALAVACIPAIGWSAWVAARAWSDWADASRAVRAAEAMGDALHLVEALSVERGALQERALSPIPGVEDLAEIAAHNDALLARAERSMHAAGLPVDAVLRARDLLVSTRRRVADEVVLPLLQRDPGLVPQIMAQLYERLGDVEAAVAQAEGEVVRASASVGVLVAVGGIAVEMRAAAGRRSSHLSRWMGGRDLSLDEINEAERLTGVVQQAWERLKRQVLLVGKPQRLEAAVAATRDLFFRDAEPRYREIVAAVRAGGNRPMTLPEWRRWTIAALPGTLAARDAAVAEAVAHGEALARRARANMIVAGGAAFGVVVLALGAVLFLLRRLVLPVQRLTAIVTRIAGGDLAAEVPERGRRDEIGAMAAAIEIFKANAVELRRTNLLFDAALNNMSQGLAMYDHAERLVVTNDRFCQITGLPPDGVRLGMAYRDVLALALRAGHFPGRMLDDVYAERRSLACGRAERILDDIGDGRVIAASFEPLAGGGWVCTFDDITERRRTEAQIAHLAHHDALTNLPNRTLFRKRLEEALARARRGEGFALLCLDLDRFKEVNDTLGHLVGDALLRAVTKRLQAHVRETDTVARLGGDEFAIVQVSADQPRDAAAFAQRLVEAIGRPYEVEGHHIVVGASVGVALGPGDGANPDELLKNADLALYQAKADGRAAWRPFLREMDARVQARRLLEMDLRRALAGSEFELHYQPLVHLRLRRPTGLEALIRWRHAERGLVPPADFIPLAEEIGLIVPIGEWIMQRACTEAVTWPGAPKVAVNVSAAQFRRGSALIEAVAHALRASGLPPARFEIEITETAMLHDTEETFAALHRIRQMGVSVALDDFGTGFSSLSYLRRFPFDRVKIDRSFVEDLRRKDGAALVRAVVGLCRDLGMAVTAEGVETEEQLKWLAAEGVTDAQGYLFSRPVPAAMVPTVLGGFRWSSQRLDGGGCDDCSEAAFGPRPAGEVPFAWPAGCGTA